MNIEKSSRYIYWGIILTLILLIAYWPSDNVKDTDAEFENGWRTPSSGNEYSQIGALLVSNNISCAEMKIKESIITSGYFICACRTKEYEDWRTYQMWPKLNQILKFDDDRISKPNP